MPNKEELEKIQEALGTKVFKSTGHGGGGCISEGQTYETDTGRVFIKYNKKSDGSGVSWQLALNCSSTLYLLWGD